MNTENKQQSGCRPTSLPTLDHLVTLFKFLSKKTFHKNVCTHDVSGASLNLNKALDVLIIIAVMMHMMSPKPVPLDQEVLGPVCDLLLGCKKLSLSTVVLEGTTVESRMKRLGLMPMTMITSISKS
jgi:hypothetical protein